MEFVQWKVWFSVVLVVFVLAAVTPCASAQTATDLTTDAVPATVQTGGPGGGGGGGIGIGNVDIRCYTCDNVPDNDECNGQNLGENGTLTMCPYARSNCFSIIKTNDAGDGYTMQKGCMEYDECYDQFYEMLSNPIVGGNCMQLTLLNDDPIPGGEECFFCCGATEGGTQDSCNQPAGMAFLSLPSPNNWDPAADKWPGHEYGTVAPTGGTEGVARPLAVVIIINILVMFTVLA